MNFKLGIIGGMGPHAGVAFHRQLIDATPSESDQDHLSIVHVQSPAIGSRVAAIESSNHRPVVGEIAKIILQLEQIGCTHVVMACNTAHYFIAEILATIDQHNSSVQLIDMLSATFSFLQRRGVEQIVLTGRKVTLTTSLFDHYADNFQIQLIRPDPVALQQIDDIIVQVKQGIHARSELNSHYQVVITQITQATGCSDLLSACTELSLLEVDTHTIYDPVTITIEEILQRWSNTMRA